MKIHEYQAKDILRHYNIPVPRGEVAESPEKAQEIASSLGTRVVIKAQVLSGGRGKGGGIRLARTPEEAFRVAKEILGMNLITPQTSLEGKRVQKVLVEEAIEIKRELYLGLVVDRSRTRECVVYMASDAGGMDIEEVAKSVPEKIIMAEVQPVVGFSPFQARKLFYGLGLEGFLAKQFFNMVEVLYQIFSEKDASLIEINPLVLTKENSLMALDTKIDFDEDSLFRHPEIKGLRDEKEDDPLEVEAFNAGVNYIKLDGKVGCMVNGAGLAMATMDLIKLAGGEPANFLDVGGGASPAQVEKAFRILTADPKVKVILVNIFGGILRCDRVATGLIEAASKIEKKLPMVVRLQGTNVAEGRRLLQESDLAFEVAEELYEAASKAVEIGKKSN